MDETHTHSRLNENLVPCDPSTPSYLLNVQFPELSWTLHLFCFRQGHLLARLDVAQPSTGLALTLCSGFGIKIFGQWLLPVLHLSGEVVSTWRMSVVRIRPGLPWSLWPWKQVLGSFWSWERKGGQAWSWPHDLLVSGRVKENICFNTIFSGYLCGTAGLLLPFRRSSNFSYVPTYDQMSYGPSHSLSKCHMTVLTRCDSYSMINSTQLLF